MTLDVVLDNVGAAWPFSTDGIRAMLLELFPRYSRTILIVLLAAAAIIAVAAVCAMSPSRADRPVRTHGLVKK